MSHISVICAVTINPYLSSSNCNPGIEFSVLRFGIQKFLIPISRSQD